MLSRKKALITDLDNTLFDWFELWYKCFSVMLHGIVEISGIPRTTLIPEIKRVHEKHGTSEYSLLINELPSLKPLLRGRSTMEVFRAPIESYREERRKYLRLYPSVAETLLKIKGSGSCIIGYTESMQFYSSYRVRRLGLDGVLDYVFFPKDHLLPDGVSHKEIRKYPEEHYKFRYCVQKYTPINSKKPDTKVLNKIIFDLGLKKRDCVYVGDSLTKDIAMALDAGVDSVWAKYGEAKDRPGYELLRAVTHWTAEEVEMEKNALNNNKVHPTHTLEWAFEEILNIFRFGDFYNAGTKNG